MQRSDPSPPADRCMSRIFHKSFDSVESSGPVTYHYGPSVTYKTSSGVEIPEAEVRTRIVAGAPVRVHCVQEGDRRVIQRVVLRDRGDKDDDDDDN